MRRILSLAFVAVLLCAAAADAGPLKVITWNLHHGRDIDMKDTVEAQSRWLALEYPDIVLLQEAEQFTSYGNFDHVTYIRNAIQKQAGKTYYAFWANASGVEYGKGAVTAIISRFPLKSVDGRAMPYSRPLTMANVEVLPSRVIALFSLHLASWQGYDSQRATQVAELVYWLTVRGTKVRLFGGDWNMTPDSVPIAPVHYWYKDLYKKAQSLNVFSGPDETRPVYQSNSVVGRIDALFLGKAWPSWMTLTSLEHVNTGLSDHYPVVAQFNIQ